MMYAVLQELRKQRCFYSLDFFTEEIIELADRAFTMYQGRINHEFKRRRNYAGQPHVRCIWIVGGDVYDLVKRLR